MQVYPLVGDLLNRITLRKEGGPRGAEHALNDRLLQLVGKGVFYEACVDFCQAQALGNKKGKFG